MSQQPKDNANEPIPVLGFRPNGGHQVPFTASTSNTSPRIANSVRALPLALNISTKERATIINPMSSNKCKFIINVIYD